ncbi:MAG: hypothetical protein IT539_04025 [Bradyrhizobiaceae bacterium]|nr:hypothetical protein [Bradyrhizobiaceae bacterium]
MRFAYPRRVLTVLPGGRPNPRSLSTPPRAISEPPEPVSEPLRGRISRPYVSIVDNFEPEEPFFAAHYVTRT